MANKKKNADFNIYDMVNDNKLVISATGKAEKAIERIQNPVAKAEVKEREVA